MTQPCCQVNMGYVGQSAGSTTLGMPDVCARAAQHCAPWIPMAAQNCTKYNINASHTRKRISSRRRMFTNCTCAVLRGLAV